jgi:hypothetical protein
MNEAYLIETFLKVMGAGLVLIIACHMPGIIREWKRR